MNHYSILIRDYLTKEKSVSFEKIGSLIIHDKNISSDLPAQQGFFQFRYDKKATTSQGLINYITERTGKNRELVQSDIDSYMELMRQLINIGKPYEIEGIGEISLAKTNEYEFTPYKISPNKEEHKITHRHFEKSSLTANNKKYNKSVLMLVALLIILAVLGVIGWGTYKLFVTTDIQKSIIDTMTTTGNSFPVNDTVNKANNGLLKDTLTAIKDDTAYYKFIFETTFLPERAYTRTEQLREYGEPADYDSLFTDSIMIYQLYLKMRLYTADTASAKDSIQKSLRHKIKIVRMN